MLSSPIEQIRDAYSVVVVGSGYGASIAASRLARAGQTVCVLERGKEFQPGDYPNSEIATAREMQASTPAGRFGPKTGLYEFNFNDDINVFKGCGLGGTSLVNANVSLRAEPRVFQDARWPTALRADLLTRVEEGYGRAEEMLKPSPYPNSGYPTLPKLQALELSAQALGAKFYRPPINVNFTLTGPNHVGVKQRPCTCCGDCVTGCNYAAKNTLIMNYLPDARNYGAEIFTGIDVRWIEPSGAGWLIHYVPLNTGRAAFNAPEMTMNAGMLILGAGALGSTEILLRSISRGIPFSGQVGARFTGNGDVLGFAYNTKHAINGVGWGHHRAGEIPPVGPCITGVIDLREQPELDNGMVIEEGSPPGPIAGFLPAGLSIAAGLVGRQYLPSTPEKLREAYERLASTIEGPYRGAVHRTETYLVMTHDGGDGRMTLEKDELRIRWPGVGARPIFDQVNATLAKAANALGGEYLINPMWTKLSHNNLMSVHPLGGCVMADDAAGGVVNHKGQVFRSASGAAVYENLYVMDGAVVPLPLGVNPLLTISALAERAVKLAAEERGWSIDYSLPSKPAAPPPQPKTGIEFTETMSGYFSTAVKDDFERGADAGKAAGSSFSFTLTIVSEDLAAMLSDPDHPAGMVGSVNAPALSADPLMVTDGRFSLFALDPSEAGVRRMWYRMTLSASNAKTYYFEGYKVIRDNPAYDVWHDATTLYIALYDGASNTAAVLGKGILVIRPQDFLDQLTTMRVTNARTLEERLDAEARFARFFLGVLAQKYGRLFQASGNP